MAVMEICDLLGEEVEGGLKPSCSRAVCELGMARWKTVVEGDDQRYLASDLQFVP